MSLSTDIAADATDAPSERLHPAAAYALSS